jgi:hypothetical protein
MFESGTFGEEDYERSLTTSERAIADRRYAHIAAGHAAAAEADRRAYFAGLEAEIAAAEAAANDGSELGEGPDSSRPAGLEPTWRAPLADPQFRHAGLEPASSMPLGDHDDESAPTEPPAATWTPVQGRVDEGMENATPIRHAGLEPASRAPLGDDGDQSAPTEPPAGTWTPAQGRGDEILVDAPDDTPAPGPTPWPSFAQMLAGDPAELARYGVRVD